jgi:hypothetical protein
MLHAGGDVGDDFCQLQFAIPPVAVGEYPHRHRIFSDPIDPAGQLKLGTEGGFQEAVDDLAVGEIFLLGMLARRDRGNLRCGRAGNEGAERDPGEGDRECS